MIRHILYPDRDYALIVIEGSPDVDELIQGAQDLAEEPDFFDDLHRIWDFTQADLAHVSTSDMIAFSRAVKGLPIEDEARTAMIADTPGKVGLLKLFTSKFDATKTQVCRSRADALRFISHKTESQSSESGAIRIHRLDGKVTVRMIEEKNNAWFNHPDFDATDPILWDLRGAEFTDSLPVMERFGADMFELQKQTGNVGKSAALVTSSYQKVILQHCFKNSIAVGRTQLFRDEAEARRWLLD